MRENEEITLDIIDIDHLGLGIGKVDNFPIFIDNAIPGEKVVARIEKLTKNLGQAKNIKIIEESNNREKNICTYYSKCGGCNIMHLKYDYQIKYKTDITKKTIRKVSGLNPIIHDCVKNEKIYGYRNKVQVPLSLVDGEIISGFYEEKSHTIVPMTNCLIEPIETSSIINDLKEMFKELNISIYNEQTNKGSIRHIMCRINNEEEIMLVIVATNNLKEINQISKEIIKKHPKIVSIYLNINNQKTNVVLGKEFKLIEGQAFITETINNLKFNVHPNSFLQVNHDQCEKLYDKAIEYANLSKDDIVIDAYCGIGSITLNLAKKAKKVYGIEIVKEAIDNANENKKINNIDNVEFICGPCENEIKKLVSKEKIDVIVFDPPRKGCDIEFLNTVIDMKIPKIVYISCKTSTFARDAKILSENGYELIEVTPFDLFSHSTHVETVAFLSIK